MNQSKIILEPMEDLERRLKEELEKLGFNNGHPLVFYAVEEEDRFIERHLYNGRGNQGSIKRDKDKYIGFFIPDSLSLTVAPSRYTKEPSQDEVKDFDEKLNEAFINGYNEGKKTERKLIKERGESYDDGYAKAVEKMMGMVEREKKLSYEKGYENGREEAMKERQDWRQKEYEKCYDYAYKTGFQYALTKMRAAIVTAEKGE